MGRTLCLVASGGNLNYAKFSAILAGPTATASCPPDQVQVELEAPFDWTGVSCDRLGGLTRAVVLVKAPRGYLACGYFSLASADKFGEACGLVTGVDCAEDVLGVRLTAVSRRGAEQWALRLPCRPG